MAFTPEEEREIKKLAREAVGGTPLEQVEEVDDFESGDLVPFMKYDGDNNTFKTAKIAGTNISSGGGGGGGEPSQYIKDASVSQDGNTLTLTKKNNSTVTFTPTSGGSSVTPSDADPLEDGTKSAGSSTSYSRGDHRHPHDTTKADKSEMAITPGTGDNTDKTTIQLKDGLSTTVLTQHQDITGKVDKVNGKGLSSNDYTTDEKNKLNNIENGAEKHKAPTSQEVKDALGTGSGTTKYLREDGEWATPPSGGGGNTADVNYDTTNKKITKTIDGVTSDVVTAATLKTDMNLGNVGNFKAVSTVASQGLTDTEKGNARTNIGAGTSNFSGSYNDLTNKPTIPCADKSYTPLAHSGLGRKNLELKDGSNVLTQSDFDQANTIYVVGYDFDLDGETIEMPESCVLDFEGGSFSNGKIVSNNTEIIGVIPENSSNYYGTFYHNHKPLNYNLKEVKKTQVGILSGFMAPATYLDYRFYPQSIAVFYYTDPSEVNPVQKKYYLIYGVIPYSSPERNIFVLLNEFYDYIGSTENPYSGHGGGVVVVDDKVYVGNCINNEAEVPDKTGIAVFSLTTLFSACKAEFDASNPTPHTDTYSNKISSIDYISFGVNCVYIDYDASNEEFAIIDGLAKLFVCDKSFNILRYNLTRLTTELAQKLNYPAIFQSVVYKNGIANVMVWMSDYPNIDEGNNCIIQYDTVKDKILSYEFIDAPYRGAESEGMYKDPDDDNNIYLLLGTATDFSVEITILSKFSQVNNITGLDLRRGGSASIKDLLRSTDVRVDNSYDFSNGTSNGSSLRPYKNLDTAILMSFGYYGGIYFSIKGTNKEYILPNTKIASGSTWVFRSWSSTPTVVGAIWVWGARFLTLSIKFKAKQQNEYCLRVDNKGFVMPDKNTSFNSSDSATTKYGIYITETSSLVMEGCSFNNLTYGVYGGGEASTIYGSGTFNNCNTGILADLCTLKLAHPVFNSCTTGMEVYRGGSIIAASLTFDTCTSCILIDETKIVVSYKNINITNCNNIIYKPANYRAEFNLFCQANSNEELALVFAFIKKGKFNNTTVALMVGSRGISYNGQYLDCGLYFYNDPNFRKVSSDHDNIVISGNTIKIIETMGPTERLPTTERIGLSYFDTTIGRPVYWNGTKWINADGTDVTEYQ